MTLLAVTMVWRHGKADGLDLATQKCMRERVSVNFTEMRDIAGALPTTFAMARLVVGSALRINRPRAGARSDRSGPQATSSPGCPTDGLRHEFRAWVGSAIVRNATY
ncbi:hypothetical protein K466DRAFT_410007 [Polyporus arcularius HHB13444]|uniref:Uncharacterized protein n=1 Tax=Polyporus arcularius HHB13444 TaxID=1314778 RepID=A0A5C3PP14_9APHY|nr:hypothetical protein K466DRAFT_410007 [Polyporus arcularius HHB13444]